jgi:hypothetical protein
MIGTATKATKTSNTVQNSIVRFMILLLIASTGCVYGKLHRADAVVYGTPRTGAGCRGRIVRAAQGGEEIEGWRDSVSIRVAVGIRQRPSPVRKG